MPLELLPLEVLDDELLEVLDDELLVDPMVPPVPLELLELSPDPASPPAPVVTVPPPPVVAVVWASPEHPEAQIAVAKSITHEERIGVVFMATWHVIIFSALFGDFSARIGDDFLVRREEIFMVCKNGLRFRVSW